jgi:cysteine desulfurase
VFTSGGTEANNLAILGTASVSARRRLVTSTVEHPATAEPCAHLRRRGWSLAVLPVDADGVISLDGTAPGYGADAALLTVILAQNETGTLQPVARLAAWAHEQGALVHTDAAQAVGKVPVHVDRLGVDLLSIAGHKLYAPKGVGALYVRRGVRLDSVLRGAGQEQGRRPGTENVAAIVGLGAAAAAAARDLSLEAGRQGRLRNDLWERLRAAIPGVRRNGHPGEVLPNTLNISFPGVIGSAVLEAAPAIAAATGSACHEGDPAPSPVLTAMGLDARTAMGAVRLSLGRGTTPTAVLEAAEALITAFRHLADR